MPEVWFRVRWPDASQTRCYSPSTIVKDYFEAGAHYPLEEFLDRSRKAYHAASERVRQRYGYACSSAAAQLGEIERLADGQTRSDQAEVVIESFEEH